MRKTLLAAAIAAVLFLPLLRFKKGDSLPPASAAGSFLEDVQVVHREEGREVWSLLSAKTTISSDGSTAGMREVTVRLPGRGLTVTAEKGSFNLESSDLSLEGNVTASTEDFTVSTARVMLASATGELATDDVVVIKGTGFTIKGKGLRAYDDKVRLLEDVRAELY